LIEVKLMKRALGALLTLMAGTCRSTASVLGKLTMDLGYSPLTVVAYRLGPGFTILLVIALLWQGRKVLTMTRKMLLLLVLAGVIGVGFGTPFYFWAVSLIGASLAVILLYATPIFTLLSARSSLHERINKA